MFTEYLEQHDLSKLLGVPGSFRPFPRRQERGAWEGLSEAKRQEQLLQQEQQAQQNPENPGGEEPADDTVQQRVSQLPENSITLSTEQLYDLAKLQHEPLAPEAMSKFIARSNEL